MGLINPTVPRSGRRLASLECLPVRRRMAAPRRGEYLTEGLGRVTAEHGQRGAQILALVLFNTSRPATSSVGSKSFWTEAC